MNAPALIRGLPQAEYLAAAALSPSGAARLLRSPAHYRAWRDTPQTDTPALRVGRALHALALEGRDAFAARFAVAPEVDRRTREGKETWAAFQAEAAGRFVLTAAEGGQAEAMARALAAHELVPAALEGAEAEVSILWQDPETGAPLKGRPDALRLEAGVVLDLKSTVDASPGPFARSALAYGYATQAAAYREALAAAGGEVADHVLIVVEKDPPHGVAVYRLADAALELGRRRWREAVTRYAECLDRAAWPAYAPTITELALPAWAMGELYAEED